MPRLEGADANRWQYIDALRALSVYCIVLTHCFPNGEEFFLRKIIYIFHVPLFFLVSGYLLKSDQSKSFGEVVRERFKSIMVPYIFYVAILDPLYYATDKKHLRVATYFDDMSFWSGHLSYTFLWTMWILPALFMGWIICYLLFKHVKNGFIQVLIFLICLTVSFFASATKNFETPLPQVLAYFGFLRLFAVVPFIMLGYWFRKFNIVDLPKVSSWLLICGGFTIAAAIGFILQPIVTMNRYIYGNFFFLFAAAGAALLAMLLLASKIKKYPGFIVFFGTNTISVLVLHHGLIVYLRSMRNFDSYPTFIVIVLSFAVSTALTAVLVSAA